MLAAENFLACWVPLKVLSCTGVRHLQIKSCTALLIAVAHTTCVSLLTGSISRDALHIASILPSLSCVLSTTPCPYTKGLKVRAAFGEDREGKKRWEKQSLSWYLNLVFLVTISQWLLNCFPSQLWGCGVE